MAIIFLEKRKAQKRLILIFIGIILITAIIVWWWGFREKKGLFVEEIIYPHQKEVEIDFNFLKSQSLKELQPFFEIKPLQITPLAEGEIEEGRENPFLPY